MTSRISFSKTLLEEMKHHIVSLFVVCMFFLMKTLFFYFDVQNILRRAIEGYYKEMQLVDLSEPSVDIVYGFVLLGVVLAAEYFSYLFSQKKTDFYMSLPVKRNRQLLMGALVCGLMFVVPFVGGLAIETALLCTAGISFQTIFINALWKLALGILVFALAWVSMACAVCLTGNFVVSMLAFGVISGYTPVLIQYLCPTFEEFFYETYANINQHDAIWNYFSPVSLAIGVTNNWGTWDEWRPYFIASLVFLIAASLLLHYLYRIRPAEAAGRAMAFDKTKTPVKILVTVPLALYFGYFLTMMSALESKGWLVVGTIFGAILIHGIMESIYQFDLKQMFSRKKHLAFAIGICLGILAFFEWNTESYNTYVPEKEEVESVQLFIGGSNVNFYEMYGASSGMSGDAAEDTIALIESIVADGMSETEYDHIYVEYQLSNHKTEARRYRVGLDAYREALDALFVQEDYKNDFYRIYQMKAEDIVDITFEYGFQREQLLLSESEQETLWQIYKKELTEQTFTDLESAKRVACFEIHHIVEGQEFRDFYYVDEEFEETLAYLREIGYVVESPFANSELVQVEFYYGDEMDEKKMEQDYLVTDLEVLQQIKDGIVWTEFYGRDYLYHPSDTVYGTCKLYIENKLLTCDIYIPTEYMDLLQKAAE